MRPLALAISVLGAVALCSCARIDRAADRSGIDRIQNVVVIYAENHSFNNLFGMFPGANGIANATLEQKTQLDHDGKPLKELTTWAANGKADPRFPKMANTYDENGGYWDHVPPPTGPGWGDRWGPGSRIPALFIGPTVKKGFIDSTSYDTTSILKFITRRFDLEPLPGVRARAGDLINALQ